MVVKTFVDTSCVVPTMSTLFKDNDTITVGDASDTNATQVDEEEHKLKDGRPVQGAAKVTCDSETLIVGRNENDAVVVVTATTAG